MLWACEVATDVARADQWMRAVQQLRERRGLSTMAAFCLAHQGAILTSAGRWSEAEAVLTRAHRMFPARSTRMNRRAVALLAELRLRQGRLEEAGELLAGLDRDPDALRPLARLHLARGDVVLARDVLDRALGAPIEGTNDGPLLGLSVELALQEGNLDAARLAADRLAEVAHSGGEAMAAMSAMARGRVAAARGEPEARALLDEAVDGFTRTGMPLEGAIARLEVARVLSASRPEVAVAEAKIALAEFERLPAPPFADAAGALLRKLGAPVRTGPERARSAHPA
jgi:tetratricopeptide (TPR) repeat protein